MSDNPKPEKKPKQRKITIDVPKDLQATYANVAVISHTAVEIVLDFAQVLPRMPRGAVVSRVIMTPAHAKMLQMALTQNIGNYERQFGQIRLPVQQPNLADDFFRFPPSDQDNDDATDGDDK